jgi:hypothetical protein
MNLIVRGLNILKSGYPQITQITQIKEQEHPGFVHLNG